MRAILEFDLPEDADAYNEAMNAGELFSAVREFDEHLRAVVKYGSSAIPEGLTDEQYRVACEDARKDLRQILEDRDLSPLI